MVFTSNGGQYFSSVSASQFVILLIAIIFDRGYYSLILSDLKRLLKKNLFGKKGLAYYDKKHLIIQT